MPRLHLRAVAVLVAFAMLYQPVAAIPEAAPVLEVRAVLAIPGTSGIIALDAQQAHVAQRLVQLGENPVTAMEAASLLTAADIEVLMANPAMLQRGGSVLGTTVFIWILIIAGVVVLAIAADNHFFVQN